MMMKIMMKVYSIFKGYLCVKIRKLGTCDCYNIADLCLMNLLIVEFKDGGINDGNPAAEMDVEQPINLPIAIDELYNLPLIFSSVLMEEKSAQIAMKHSLDGC